jgi:hypothetical protein
VGNIFRYFRHQHKLLKIVVFIFIVADIFFGYSLWRFLKNKPVVTEEIESAISQETDNIFINDVSGVQTAIKTDPLSGNISQSEHYAIKSVSFLGSEIDMLGETKDTPLNITNVKGEVFVSKDGTKTKLLISWNTDKLAVSSVVYSRGDETLQDTLGEEGPGLYHTLVLNFEPSTRYSYYITAMDRWGNKAKSEKFVLLTPSKSQSILDIINNEFDKIFIWAIKK